MARYKQLLFYAAKLPPMAADQHQPANKVEGCVSQVCVCLRACVCVCVRRGGVSVREGGVTVLVMHCSSLFGAVEAVETQQ